MLQKPDPSLFVQNFALLAEANGGTARLRKMVVQMAFQGRLVSRDEREESAADYLKRVLKVDPQRLRPSEVAPGWCTCEIGAAFEVGTGSTPTRTDSSYWTAGTIPWVTSTATGSEAISVGNDYVTSKAVKDFRLKLFSKGSLVVALYGQGKTRGQVARLLIDACVNQACAVIQIPECELILQQFVWLHFRRSYDAIRELAEGGAQPNLNVGKIKQSKISFAPPQEMKRIVARVDQLMALIDELEAKQTRKREVGARFTKASLEALTTAEGPDEFDGAWTRIVENWETVLDSSDKVSSVRSSIMGAACRGLLTQRGPGTGQDVLDRTAAAVRLWAKQSADTEQREAQRHLSKLTSQCVETPRIVLPSGWTWGTLLAVCTRLVDCHNKTAPYVAAGVMLLRTSNIRNGKILLDGVKYVSEQTYKYWSRRCPPEPGDVIITREAPMGEVGLVEPGMRVCMGQRQMLLRLAADCMLPAYLVLALRDPAFQSRLTKAAVGSTVKHLRVGDVESLIVPVPPLEEQRRIVMKVEQLMRLCDELEAKLRRAEDRASKLAEAVVQELTV